MNPLLRMMCLYTSWNFAFVASVLILKNTGLLFRQFVGANTVLIALVVAYAHVSTRMKYVGGFFRSFNAPPLSLQIIDRMPVWSFVAWDIFSHTIPLILVTIPHFSNKLPFVLAWGAFAAWFEALQQSGFMLRDTARVYRSGLDWTVRLVWRRERDRESAVLCLRLRVPVRT